MAERQVRITLRDKQTTGGLVPGNALFGEPFVNLYDGVLKFSGVTGGVFESSSQTNVFEVGSVLYNQKITNRLNINNNFIISGGTGIISTYNGANGAGLNGKFLSGTTNGFVLGNISDIQGSAPTYVQNGINTITGGTPSNPTVNLVASPSINNLTFSGVATGGSVLATSLSASSFIYSAGTSLETIIYNIASSTENITNVQGGSNILTGGTASKPVVNLVASPSVNNITYSGVSTGGSSIATNVSASTSFYSAGTSLETIIYNISNATESVTSVQGGTNILTGGTATNPTVNLIASPSVNNITFSGVATGGSVSASNISGSTFYSGSTLLESLFVRSVAAGSNINLGGTSNFPTVNVSSSPVFTGLVSATGFTDSSLTQGRVVYVGASGRLTNEAGFEYDATTDTFKASKTVIGVPGQTGTTMTIYGDVLVIGEAISGFTSQLYIEDNNIQLNYNPSASTASTSLGSGWTIQDGSGIQGTDVFLDIRGTGTTVSNRGFATNLNDIFLRESGTPSAPNGVRVLAELDILDAGSF